MVGTLASKVGENIVGKRLGMSEKDRKLLGTVFGMAGGAYGGYAGSAGFGSSGIGATGASGSAGGMGGQSPKVGGDYGTAVKVFNQPTVPGAGPGYYGSGPVGNVSNTGYQYMPAMGTEYTPIDGPSGVTGPVTVKAGPGYYGQQPVGQTGFNNVDLMGGQGYASQYDQMAGMPAESYGMDSFRINEYDQMAGMPARSYGMDMYAAKPGNEMYSIGRPDNTWVNPNNPSIKPDNWFDAIEVPSPRYQGPSSGNVSAETFALDAPSRTIDVAPSGPSLEVMDVGAYQAPAEPLYGVDPTSPTSNYLSQPYQTGTQSGSNLSMESAFQTGGDEVRTIIDNGDGTFTDLSATDLSTSQGVEEFINMDQIRLDEMNGGPLDPFGTGPNITSANSRVPSNIGANGGEVPYIVDTPPLADINVNSNATVVRGNNWANDAQAKYLEASGPRMEDFDNLSAATVNTPTARLESFDNAVFDSPTVTAGRAPMTEDAIARAQEVMSKSDQAQLDTRAIERETQNIADAINYEIPPAEKASWLDKIPDSVKQWAAETGISLLDMWIQQELFGQDYDDQIAQSGGGGGGGRTLTGTSPMVSPYSGGGGSGGGGKGLLFSMGGGGQKGGGHIMALQ